MRNSITQLAFGVFGLNCLVLWVTSIYLLGGYVGWFPAILGFIGGPITILLSPIIAWFVTGTFNLVVALIYGVGSLGLLLGVFLGNEE